MENNESFPHLEEVSLECAKHASLQKKWDQIPCSVLLSHGLAEIDIRYSYYIDELAIPNSRVPKNRGTYPHNALVVHRAV